MDARIVEPLTLYVTDRQEFTRRYEKGIEPAFCHELMMESESRPHSAERIALKLMGHSIYREKKYDGTFVEGGRTRFSEVKVTCRYADEQGKYTSMTGIRINDVSLNIIERYVHDQPLFIFPYFLDGHLAAMFSVEFKYLLPRYQRFAMQKLNSAGAMKEGGRASFSLSLCDWLEHAKVEFVHKDPAIVSSLSMALQEKIFSATNINSTAKRSNTMAITRFPAGTKFERYGYDLENETMYSFVKNPNGDVMKAKYSFKDYRAGKSYNILDVRAEAAKIAGVTLSNRRVVNDTASTKSRIPFHPGRVGLKSKFDFENLIVTKGNDDETVRVTIEFDDAMTIGDLKRRLQGSGAKITISM